MEQQERQQSTSQAQQELLYHYTTQEGLLGILRDKCIWATDIRYLNDTSEGQIFTKLFLDELNQRPTTEPEGPPSQLMMLHNS